MKVKELIQLLSTVNGDLTLSTEGCDCEADPIGLSVNGDVIIIRRKDGCYARENLALIKVKENE